MRLYFLIAGILWCKSSYVITARLHVRLCLNVNKLHLAANYFGWRGQMRSSRALLRILKQVNVDYNEKHTSRTSSRSGHRPSTLTTSRRPIALWPSWRFGKNQRDSLISITTCQIKAWTYDMCALQTREYRSRRLLSLEMWSRLLLCAPFDFHGHTQSFEALQNIVHLSKHLLSLTWPHFPTRLRSRCWKIQDRIWRVIGWFACYMNCQRQ